MRASWECLRTKHNNKGLLSRSVEKKVPAVGDEAGERGEDYDVWGSFGV